LLDAITAMVDSQSHDPARTTARPRPHPRQVVRHDCASSGVNRSFCFPITMICTMDRKQ
jgi:hypothetical protein